MLLQIAEHHPLRAALEREIRRLVRHSALPFRIEMQGGTLKIEQHPPLPADLTELRTVEARTPRQAKARLDLTDELQPKPAALAAQLGLPLWFEDTGPVHSTVAVTGNHRRYRVWMPETLHCHLHQDLQTRMRTRGLQEARSVPRSRETVHPGTPGDAWVSCHTVTQHLGPFHRDVARLEEFADRTVKLWEHAGPSLQARRGGWKLSRVDPRRAHCLPELTVRQLPLSARLKLWPTPEPLQNAPQGEDEQAVSWVCATPD